jgi:BirA family transcriptional regulator, biotin operon repressor / biotin---[acetyl-CoA-carboxylase] ligase
MEILKLKKCTSTNDAAKQLLDFFSIDEVPTLIIADKQIQGRGRSGSWWSPEGYGLYMSVIRDMYEPKPGCSCCGSGKFTDAELITEQITDKVRWTLTAVTQLSLSIQPSTPSHPICGNDIYLADKKLVGILSEVHPATNKLIIGIGINLFRPNKVRKDLLNKAVWLNEYGAEHRINKMEMAQDIAEDLLKL